MKKILSMVCVLVLGVLLLAGCGKAEEKTEVMDEMLSSVGVKTFIEVVGKDVNYIEEVEDGTVTVNYFPEEGRDELLAQYQEYLSQECDKSEFSDTWKKEDVTILVTTNYVLNPDYDFSKDGADTVSVSVYRSE